LSIDYTFALLGFKNHDLYFGHLGGDGGEPTGRFAELMKDEFHGGLNEWQQAVRKAASEARGWVMVEYDLNDGSLFNYIMDTQNLCAVYNMVPIFALDVYSTHTCVTTAPRPTAASGTSRRSSATSTGTTSIGS